jgi:hypothetical protein
VSSRWVSCWRDDQVDECEEGPDRGEDQEVDLGRGPPPCPVAGSCEVSVRAEPKSEKGGNIP